MVFAFPKIIVKDKILDALVFLFFCFLLILHSNRELRIRGQLNGPRLYEC